MTALQELMNYTFIAKYSRYLKDKKRRETWKEAVDRVKQMMLNKYPQIPEEINWAYDFMFSKKVLGSQRALQFGGQPIEKRNERIYNCSFSPCNRSRFFQEMFYLLLCGCGTGYSVQLHHIEQLPKLIGELPKERKKYIVEDSIEGWANALGVLISVFMEDPTFPEYHNKNVYFDYSQVSVKGTPLNSGGKAPGPEPLKKSLEQIRKILENCIEAGQKKISSLNAHDIICHTADSVLSGGIRRSSCIAIFSYEDKEMMGCKTGTWYLTNKQRARANNSVILLRDETTIEQFKEIINYTKNYGEPGFFFADDLDVGTNPCAEISLYAKDVESGKYGWEMCNLSTINIGNLKDEEDFYDRCRAASIIGTCQAGFTSFPYLGEITEKIVRREALLGVSMTGIMEMPDLILSPKIQKKGAEIVKKTNKEIAEKIGISISARTTTVKPEGTTSCLLGTSSGIHPHHAKRYIRHVMANKMEPQYLFFKQKNAHACQNSLWSANKTDDVILFPIEVKDGAKLKNHLSAIEMLELVKSTQLNWIDSGRNKELCVKPCLRHNVSNTIVVKDDEWDLVTDFLFKNRQDFAAVSLLSYSGDKDYAQAPNTGVLTSREIVRDYGDAALWCSGLIEKGVESFGHLWTACDTLLYEAEKESILDKEFEKLQKRSSNLNSKNLEQIDSIYKEMFAIKDKICWINKAKSFSKKFFDGDIRKMTYCLKDVYNWKLYCDISRDFQKVDFSEMVEEEDNNSFESEPSCAGGACLI